MTSSDISPPSRSPMIAPRWVSRTSRTSGRGLARVEFLARERAVRRAPRGTLPERAKASIVLGSRAVPDRFTRLPTTLEGPVLIEPAAFGDERGFFSETYRRSEFVALGIVEEMVQDNHSRSRHGVVRGLHFQVGRGAGKLVRCARGEIWDVAVDLRRGSPGYGRWEGFELSDENLRMVYVPPGFAHGFCVLSEVADVLYKQDAYYADATERGIRYDDPDVAIAWPLPVAELIPSQRDSEAPLLRDVADELPFAYVG
jgi:dTDP-4-dehydrorhamnose 3,5-epimerase